MGIKFKYILTDTKYPRKNYNKVKNKSVEEVKIKTNQYQGHQVVNDIYISVM